MRESPRPNPFPDDDDPTAPPRSRLRRWAVRCSLAFAGFLLVLLIVLNGGRAYFRHTGQRALDAETARLDAEEPGWRFDDLMAAREKTAPPEAENSAVIVRQVRKRIPAEWQAWVKQPPVQADDEPTPLNRKQRHEDLTRDDDLAAATRPARDLGLTLRNYPRGYHVVAVSDSPFVESLEETQGTREVMHLMKIDSLLAAQGGDPVRGLRAAHAILNTARSVGDEPTVISSLVRFAGASVTSTATMQVLALTDPKAAVPELAALQAALIGEAEEPVLLNGLRGERAFMNRFFEGINSGTITSEKVAQMAGLPGDHNPVFVYYARAFVPEDQRRYLRLMSSLIAAAKEPPHRQAEICRQIEDELKASRDFRYRWHALMLPAATKVMEADARRRAELLSVATLIACERFRIARGHWPESLADLPKDLLPEVPIDPYTGAPLKFAKLPDGIAVYAAAPLTSLGQRKRLNAPLGGTEIGWRLYDPAVRGLPALPPRPKPEGDLPPGGP